MAKIERRTGRTQSHIQTYQATQATQATMAYLSHLKQLNRASDISQGNLLLTIWFSALLRRPITNRHDFGVYFGLFHAIKPFDTEQFQSFLSFHPEKK